MKTRFSSILKKLLLRIIIAAILFFAKQYFSLDLINDLVDKLISVISAFFLLDFSPFIFEITKTFFNEKSGNESEGSNRQNNNNTNNTTNQGSSINPTSSGEASGVAETTPDNQRVEVTDEELDEEERRLIAEQTRLIAQYQARVETRFVDQLVLNERIAQINQRIIDFNNLRNQSQPDGSPVPGLTDIDRQIQTDREVLREDGKRIVDEINAYNAEVDKLLLEKAKLLARKLEKEINERNSK